VSADARLISGRLVREHCFRVPLDHQQPDGERIDVFARELAEPDGRERPFLVFLQGGPGFEAPRPSHRPSGPGWVQRALTDYRVLLLDQRGTGRSAPIGSLPGMTAEQQADHLVHFRADSIVRDCEWIRRELGIERWSVLGQSFGGFCVTVYLSQAPEHLAEAFITGGLPPLQGHLDDVYPFTYERVRERQRRHLERYPQDGPRLASLRRRLQAEPLTLPSGDLLSWRRFALSGQMLGMSDGSERLHHLLELPPDSPGFLHDAEAATSFARNPLYAILQEPCWGLPGATRWAAQRLLPPDFEEHGLLTGEHVFAWLFEEQRALVPLREAAELLAEREWPALYDADRLAANAVPVAAAIYTEDMYVERHFSEQTAARIGGLRSWVTSEYDHNGLRVDGERILGRLIDLARGNL
jgi:pimeloyl-ACP methyl ester carboxylesterase